MAKSKKPPTPKDPQGSKDKKSVRRFAPPIPTVPQQYQYPQSLPQYKSVDEIHAIYNMFLQNYERTRMEGQRAANLKEVDQYINRGFRDPIEQPVAPQFRNPTAPGIGGIAGGIAGQPSAPGAGGIAGGNAGRIGGPMPPTMPRPPQPGGGRVPLPMPGTRVPPSSGKFEGFVPLPYPGNPGIRNPQPYQPPQPPNAPRPSQPSPKPPIYKSPPTGGVFGPQPPIDLSDKLPPRVSGFQPAGPDKLPPHVKEFKLGPKKPTLDSFIPRYLRDSRKA